MTYIGPHPVKPAMISSLLSAPQLPSLTARVKKGAFVGSRVGRDVMKSRFVTVGEVRSTRAERVRNFSAPTFMRRAEIRRKGGNRTLEKDSTTMDI